MSPAFWIAVAFGLSAAGTFAIRTYAIRRELYDHPNDRSSHKMPTPRLGGIAVAFAALVGWAGLALNPDHATAWILPLVAGGAVAALIGLIDDLKALSPPVKLIGQIAAAALALALMPDGGTAVSLTWMLLVGFGLVTYMNFFNFMDGSDGMAGGIGVLAPLGLAWLATAGAAAGSSSLALVLAAAAAGFLVFNFPPASIFMGDTGSLFLGFAIGMLAFGSPAAGVTLGAAALVLSPFLFDAGYTVAARAIAGHAVWRPHRTHLYQRLMVAGASHKRVALIYYAWTVLAAGLAWAWMQWPAQWRPWIAVCGMLPAAALVWYVRRSERLR
jgi:UDP-N-acetylmuramyl pentapeptide phosphotransferase/UDP-N-acetylglucosamine-1-phosphate transferase